MSGSAWWGGSGSTHVCIVLNVLTLCSSSLRYKQNVQPLSSGLNLIQRLRPVTFEWKDRLEADLGLIAEEVAAVEPLLVTHNKTGEIEGVKYDQLSVVLINAVNEQQAEIANQEQKIETQAKVIDALGAQIAALKKLVCVSNPNAAICKEEQ